MLPCAAPKSIRGYETTIDTRDAYNRALSGTCMDCHSFMDGWIIETYRIRYFDDEGIVAIRRHRPSRFHGSGTLNYDFFEWDIEKNSYVWSDKKPEEYMRHMKDLDKVNIPLDTTPSV